MGLQRSPKQLLKFIAYMLGRRPDEFGLAPDAEGFVKIKELLRAVCEENGWGYVRRSHINEILITFPDPEIEIKGEAIRSLYRDQLPVRKPAQNPPKLLYICVRQKAYPFVLDKGISPMGRAHVILSARRDLAERMGRRIDSTPVLLTVLVQKSLENGVGFYQSGEWIYLVKSIPPGCFTGPPLPKQKPESKKPEKEEPRPQKTPGSYFPDFGGEKSGGKEFKQKMSKKEISWKKERKRMKRQKQKMWPL